MALNPHDPVGHRLAILALCARRKLEPAQATRARQLTASPQLDWNELLRDAARHRLTFMLSHHLKAADVSVPDVAAAQLHAAEVQNAARTLSGLGNLIQTLAALRAAGIDALPYKGPVLALQLYGSPALRHAGDLDIVVRPSAARQARDVLTSRGYTPVHPTSADLLQFMLRNRYSDGFRRAGHADIELHWAFTNRDIGLRLSLDDLLPRAAPLRLGGAQVPVFGAEDLVLVLCVHGAKHRWERLEWLGGLGEAMRQCRPDWGVLFRRAHDLGVVRMTLLGSLLADEIVQAGVPADVLAAARRDRHVSALASEVRRVLREPPLPRGAISVPVDRFRFNLRERLLDRARFVGYRLTTPSRPEEWRLVNVGNRQIPLHALVRPFQLVGRAVQAAFAAAGRQPPAP